jgi:hypothetical protein
MSPLVPVFVETLHGFWNGFGCVRDQTESQERQEQVDHSKRSKLICHNRQKVGHLCTAVHSIGFLRIEAFAQCIAADPVQLITAVESTDSTSSAYVRDQAAFIEEHSGLPGLLN